MSQVVDHLKRDQARSEFVCVFNRNRDGYEVALALHEAGLLDRLITDFYCPDGLNLPAPFALRRRRGLPSAKVMGHYLNCLVQYGGSLLRLPRDKVFALADRLLARAANARARRIGAGIYAYSSYFDGAPDLRQGATVIDFEYHPHPAYSLELLAADFAINPQVAWSFRREQAVAANETLSTAWQYADAVVCASSMTKRALVHAGCPADRVTVIPYGTPEGAAPPPIRADRTCRFLFVGQGIQRKGLHHLARAWKSAALTEAELTVISYLIDPGIAAMLEIPGVTILGRQTRDELDRAFGEADVFVMPSLVEGFGLVYLEALSFGCHVIGSTNSGLADLPLGPASATLVKPGDNAALEQAMRAAARAKADGTLDPIAIQAEALAWSWADFRRSIGEHARKVAKQ